MTDTLLAFPFLVLAVGLAAIIGPSLFTATVAIGIAGVPAIVRVTRSETLRLRGLDFVAAAVADGASDLVAAAPAHPAQRGQHAHRAGDGGGTGARSSVRPCCPSSAWASGHPRRRWA